ncbi:MAG: STAS domain-containing protein [Phycisphaerae bacterium]
MSEQKIVSIDQRDGLLVNVVNQETLDDESTRRMLSEALDGAATARACPVVLDLSAVAFFPSVSLSALVELLNTLTKAGQKLILVGLQQDVRESLAITRLDKLFEIRDDVEAILAHQRREDASHLD